MPPTLGLVPQPPGAPGHLEEHEGQGEAAGRSLAHPIVPPSSPHSALVAQS